MKQARRSMYLITLIFTLFMLQQFHLLGPAISHIESVPWWVYLVVAGILFSGYQAFTISKAEREVDEKWLEEQGEVYMKRIKAEKERRHAEEDPKAMNH